MILLVLTILINIILIYQAINVKPLCLMYIFFLTYSVNLIPFYFLEGEISLYYYDFNEKIYYDRVLLMHFLFFVGLLTGTKKWSRSIILRDNIKLLDNRLGYYLCLSIMVLIIFFGKTGSSILESGAYGRNETSQLGGLAIHEYFVIFLPVAYIFGNGKTKLLVSISILYVIKTFLFGTRVEILQVLAVLFILYETKKTSWRRILPYLGISFVLFTFIGIFRSDPIAFIYGSSFLDFDVLSLFKAFNNQNDIFYSSARIIGMIDNHILSTAERIQSAFYSVIAIFIPYRFLPEVANLAAFKKDLYPAGGGGLISTFYFTYFSYFGPVIIGYLISRIIKLAIVSKNNSIIIYCILVLSTYFRWFGYSPIVLFKLCTYGVIVFFLLSNLPTLKVKL